MREIITPHVLAVEKQLKKNNTGFLVGNEVNSNLKYWINFEFN